MALFRDMEVLSSKVKTNLNMGMRQPMLFLETEANCMHDLSRTPLPMRNK
jgi:hypothetical protein